MDQSVRLSDGEKIRQKTLRFPGIKVIILRNQRDLFSCR